MTEQRRRNNTADQKAQARRDPKGVDRDDVDDHDTRDFSASRHRDQQGNEWEKRDAGP
jgi:hypothetical protein